MQITRLFQVIALMLLIALAVGCAASKEYTSKIFTTKNDSLSISKNQSFRFLEMDSLQSEKEGWVSTDIIMGRDTISNTIALDQLTKTLSNISDTLTNSNAIKEEKTTMVNASSKPDVNTSEQQVVKINNPTGVRIKRTRNQ